MGPLWVSATSDCTLQIQVTQNDKIVAFFQNFQGIIQPIFEMNQPVKTSSFSSAHKSMQFPGLLTSPIMSLSTVMVSETLARTHDFSAGAVVGY
jgi:hypothetical protein